MCQGILFAENDNEAGAQFLRPLSTIEQEWQGRGTDFGG
jgi:hypothetical protein